jgi:hypothetical protein
MSLLDQLAAGHMVLQSNDENVLHRLQGHTLEHSPCSQLSDLSRQTGPWQQPWTEHRQCAVILFIINKGEVTNYPVTPSVADV